MTNQHPTSSAMSGPTLRKRRGKFQIFAAVLIALIFGITACSDDSDSSTDDNGDTPSGEARQVEVSGADDFTFNPDAITVGAGDEVTLSLTSEGALEHDFVIDEASFEVTAAAGETAEGTFTIDEPGTYTYYCSVAGHREAGMEGTLTVE